MKLPEFILEIYEELTEIRMLMDTDLIKAKQKTTNLKKRVGAMILGGS